MTTARRDPITIVTDFDGTLTSTDGQALWSSKNGDRLFSTPNFAQLSTAQLKNNPDFIALMNDPKNRVSPEAIQFLKTALDNNDNVIINSRGYANYIKAVLTVSAEKSGVDPAFIAKLDNCILDRQTNNNGSKADNLRQFARQNPERAAAMLSKNCLVFDDNVNDGNSMAQFLQQTAPGKVHYEKAAAGEYKWGTYTNQIYGEGPMTTPRQTAVDMITNNFDKLNSLDRFAWRNDLSNRELAVKAVSEMQNGGYAIRPSSNPDCIAVTYKEDDQIKHALFAVSKNAKTGNIQFIDPGNPRKTFNSIHEGMTTFRTENQTKQISTPTAPPPENHLGNLSDVRKMYVENTAEKIINYLPAKLDVAIRYAENLESGKELLKNNDVVIRPGRSTDPDTGALEPPSIVVMYKDAQGELKQRKYDLTQHQPDEISTFIKDGCKDLSATPILRGTPVVSQPNQAVTKALASALATSASAKVEPEKLENTSPRIMGRG